MSTKIYHRQENGTVSVISRDKNTGENRIPNYVWDLWLPLLGGDAIAVYSLYCRLQRNGKVKGVSMKDIAKACKIGIKKLNKINIDLSFCGFISVVKPEGKARLMHWTSEITMYLAPTEVLPAHIEYLKADNDYKIIAEWLVTDDDEYKDLPKSQVASPKEPIEHSEGTKQVLARQSDDHSKIESFNLNPCKVESSAVEFDNQEEVNSKSIGIGTHIEPVNKFHPKLDQTWMGAKGTYQLQLNKNTYETWVRHIEFINFSDGTLTLLTRNSHDQFWLSKNLSQSIITLYGKIGEVNVTALTLVNPYTDAVVIPANSNSRTFTPPTKITDVHATLNQPALAS